MNGLGLVRLSVVLGFLVGCNFQSFDGNTLEDLADNNSRSETQTCENPDNLVCKIVGGHSTFIEDSFEREDVFDDSVPAQQFGWRMIINDNGRIINGEAGNHVNMEIFDDTQLGPASHGSRALYNFGRQGRSIHNLYLLSKTFEIDKLVGGNVAIIEFDYLPIDLDSENEYLRLEVCNDTAENCGVGEEISMSGLNDSTKWEVVFSIGPDPVGDGLNGRNHALDDWRTEKVVLELENFQQSEFIFRFNSRMDEGFHHNNPNNDMEDGVAIDRVRATAYDIDDDVMEEVEEPEDILDPDNF